jgi:hypothetical protein
VDAGVGLGPVTGVVGYHEQAAIAVAPGAPAGVPATDSNPAARISAARGDPQDTNQSAARTSRVITDPQTNAIVYQSVDESTGGIIEQAPSQAALRQRAYADAQAVQALIKGKTFVEAAVAAAQEIDTTA